MSPRTSRELIKIFISSQEAIHGINEICAFNRITLAIYQNLSSRQTNKRNKSILASIQCY